jgi:hypothetical protein
MLHFICGNPLCDTSSFSFDDIGFSDEIKKGGLSVVDMSKNRNNGLTRNYSALGHLRRHIK